MSICRIFSRRIPNGNGADDCARALMQFQFGPGYFTTRTVSTPRTFTRGHTFTRGQPLSFKLSAQLLIERLDAAVQFLVVQQRLLQPVQMLAHRCSRPHPQCPSDFTLVQTSLRPQQTGRYSGQTRR
jgi:hypothetical protein